MPAKFRVHITLTAQEDLGTIWDYIAADDVLAATRFIETLETSLDTLESFPERCPRIPENDLLGTAYRHLLIGNYRLIFRLEAWKIFVLRIIHGARLLDSALFDS